MSVSEALGASLSARRWWCEPGEPVVWALWTRGTAFRVDGCDEYGLPKPGLGRRFGSAAGKVGDAVAAGVLTGIFGGGDDGGSGTRRPVQGLTVFGSGRECRAAALVRTDPPEGHSVGDVLWVLTPDRFGVLVGPRRAAVDTGPGGWRQLGHGWGDVGRALVGTLPEEFGANEPGEQLKCDPVAPWFTLERAEIADCRVVGPEHRPTQCALVLRDGSGFALEGHLPSGAALMAESMRAYLRGARG
ncbi:hypothetical protein [Saccharopolyspora sp. 7B]|uniref:hypothetical protein n=1 Tax=Saccharopolyspora sp. 7B TaxID=2877240 RepID=UPI001CD76B55|nr:hypothetical protein [Saccharopolyspora sp. 7B]MCA1281544.1 hypothetical protein [Saccharopolyspora sp. 7B]